MTGGFIMSKLLRLACALTLTCSFGYAVSGELGPYSSSTGEGNIAFGVYRDTFVATRGFDINWYDSPTPAAARFMDVQGSVGSVFETSEGLAPFVFSSVSLKSGDGSVFYGSVDLPQPKPTIDFAFHHLGEGPYSLQFVGHYVRSPYEEGWGVQEWGYSVTGSTGTVPEPAEMVLAAAGLGVVALWARRQARRQHEPSSKNA